MVFLNLGREPVLPLERLEDMLAHDRNGLKNLLTTLRKEKVAAAVASDEEEEKTRKRGGWPAEEEATEERTSKSRRKPPRTEDHEGRLRSTRWSLRSDGRGRRSSWRGWSASRAGGRQTQSTSKRTARAANKLIKRAAATGEYYLVRAGNTRKGTGTFYTRPQLAVPMVHRTLEPLCYDKAADGTLTPKEPKTILGLKVCDPACGSASFLVAALHYLTDALYRALCHHRHLDDPEQAKTLTLPYGCPRTGKQRRNWSRSRRTTRTGRRLPERVKALLRRHVVERCIYGVDINPLAVELARVSLWVDTLDPELPFSFLDHKIKVGNSLVGCWLDRVEDYPLKAWEREGGDGKNGETHRGGSRRSCKGEKAATARGDGPIMQEMKEADRDPVPGLPVVA